MNILRPPLLKALLKNRWPQFATMLIALSGFLLATVSGLFGTPVGSRNFGIVFVWIAWWAILMLVAIPFLGRGWCSLCPIPAPGEWLQRGRLLGPEQFVRRTLSNRMIPRENQSRLNDFVLKVRSDAPQFPLNRRWPNRFRNIWLQNGAFLLVALFSTVILTQPRVTAIVLAAFLFVAVGASLVFERRAFCRYLCPVGTLSWLAYAASFLTLILLALPGVFWLAVCSGKRRSGSIQPTKKLFIAQAYALVPLGLAAWVAFSLAFVFANFSCVLVGALRSLWLGLGPARHTDPVQLLSAARALLQGKIIRGGMGTGMPMWGAILTEEQTWALVSYLYTFPFEEVH